MVSSPPEPAGSYCPTTDPGCTWTFMRGQMLSDANQALVAAPFGGAFEGSRLTLGSCPIGTPECSWYLVDLGKMFVIENPNLIVHANQNVVRDMVPLVLNAGCHGTRACYWTFGL
jgi:hypothetical protein